MAKIAERLAYLEAVIGADITQFRKGMRDIRNETGILSEVTRGVSGFGRTLTFAYTTPLLVLGATSVQVASEFQGAMQNINSIAGMSEDQLAALSAQTLEFGKTTRSGAIASAEALYTVFSAGIMDTEDAFSLMNTAVKTSEAGLADLQTTTNGMIAVMLSYNDTSDAMAQRTSDNITRMVQVGVGSMDAFVSAIGGLVPAASVAGMEMEEWGADMAFLTQRGMSAAQAGISMNAMLKKLISPTEAMQEAFHELGGDNLPELVDQFGSVNEVIEQLINNAGGDLTQLHAMFNTTQGQRGVDHMMQGMEAWQQAQDDFNSQVTGATGRAWEEQMKSFAASWDLLKSAVQGAGIAIGQSMFPVLQPLVKMLADFINSVSSANPELIGMSVAFLAVSAAIPPLLWLLGSLLSPLGLIIGGLAALSIAFETNFGGIRDTVMNAVGGVVDDLQPLITAVDDFWTTLFPEDLQEAITGGTEPVEIDPYDYITVTEPKSLWQVYTEMGYDDQFSWQAFMDEALAGGWQGGAITPDTPIRIRPNVEFDFTSMDGLADLEASGQITAIPQIPDSVIVDPFTQAMTVALPKVQKAFFDFIAGVIPSASEAAGWVSGKVAAFLFDGITSAISYIFSGQALADTSVITNWIGDNIIDPFLLGITEGLEGTSLQTAIDGIASFVTSITDNFDTGSVDLSGFNSLIEGIKSAFDSLAAADWSGVAKLGVILGIIAGGVFETAVNILSGLSAGIGLVISSLGTGLAAIVDALALAGNGDLEGGLASLGQGLIDFGVALLQIPVGIIDALAGAIGNLFGIDIPDIGEWLSGLQTQIDDGIQNWINNRDQDVIHSGDFFKWDFSDQMPAVMENMDFLVSQMGMQIQRDWAGALPEDLIIPMDFQWTNDSTQMMQMLNGIIENVDELPAARLLAQQVHDEIIAEMQARGIDIPTDALILTNTGEMVTGWEGILQVEGGAVNINNPVVTTSGTPMMPELPPMTPSAPNELPMDFTFGGFGAGVTVPEGGEPVPINGAITGTPTEPVNLTGISLAFGEDVKSGAEAQEIIDANLLPIETAWVAMFAEDGLMATTFGTFTTNVTTGWQTIGTEVTTFNDNMNTNIPAISGMLTEATTTWSGALSNFASKVQATQSAVNSLMSTIKQLMAMQGSFSIDVNFVSTGLDADGTHKTGLDTVPFDGYLAELHKGERVLTAKQAAQMDSATYPAGSVTDTPTINENNSNVVVNINGVQDVDRMLFELKRRGIKIQ